MGAEPPRDGVDKPEEHPLHQRGKRVQRSHQAGRLRSAAHQHPLHLRDRVCCVHAAHANGLDHSAGHKAVSHPPGLFMEQLPSGGRCG